MSFTQKSLLLLDISLQSNREPGHQSMGPAAFLFPIYAGLRHSLNVSKDKKKKQPSPQVVASAYDTLLHIFFVGARSVQQFLYSGALCVLYCFYIYIYSIF